MALIWYMNDGPNWLRWKNVLNKDRSINGLAFYLSISNNTVKNNYRAYMYWITKYLCINSYHFHQVYRYNKIHILMHYVCFFVYLKITMETNHCDEIEILISVMVFCYNKTVPHYKNYYINFSLIVLSLKLILPEDYYEFLSEIMFLHVYS